MNSAPGVQPLPHDFAKQGWYTSAYLAARMSRSPRTVLYWFTHGLLQRRGFQTLRTRAYNGGGVCTWWVRIPQSSRDAMFPAATLDMDTPTPLPS